MPFQHGSRFFKGGKAAFGDMANSFSPFSIDFLLTYLVSKAFHIDEILSLHEINTWRMILLNILFAVGCRQLAREILSLRFSADFVFLITLFVGAFFLPHRPIFIMCNIYSPWILLYVTRISTQNSERLIHNLIGLTMMTCLAIFHQFNIQSTLIWPFIALYIFSLLIFGFYNHLFARSKAYLKRWKVTLATFLCLITIVASTLPLAWEYSYFMENNRKMLYPGETIEALKQESTYNVGDYIDERFEWQKLLSLVTPLPKLLETLTNVTPGMPGIFVHNFQYMGMLAALLMIVGVVFSRNKFKIPIVFGVIFYFLFSSVNRFPLFWSALQLDVPMTRHFLFTHLHLSPLLALLAGMGMDHILEKGDNSTQLKPSFKIKSSYLAFFFLYIHFILSFN